MERADDPSIDGDMVLFRRIPPDGDRVTWDESGTPSASSMNFKDRANELSLYIASETTPELALDGHIGFGLVQITAKEIREICREMIPKLVICRDNEDPKNGHILVCGKLTNGMSRRISKAIKWVPGKLPTRPPE